MPDVKVLDVIGDTVDLGFVDTLSALAYPGPDVINSELNVPPPNNCFGSLSFC